MSEDEGWKAEAGFFYSLGKLAEEKMQKKEIEMALKRKVVERIRRGFIKTYKPVMDDASYRIFQNLRDYNHWCDKELPKWLGYGKTA